ncbi:hypothetical protein D2Q93_00280 [Alicyclobacillaceae bacterium I2511]|nr:hypothetical protein D2Q93_00280 [Alicyclobacillaceae bacterium I2511]
MTVRVISSPFLNLESKIQRLGPCVGVYVRKEENPHRPFGEQTWLLSDLIQIGRQMGVDVIVLTPGFMRERMGWRYENKGHRWILGPVPYPDLVFRRSGAFPQQELEATVDLQRFRTEGRLHTLPRICGDKWQFYQDMRHNPQLTAYLPRSARATSAAHAWALLQQFRDVYIKPLQGAQGISVIHLVWQQNQALAFWEDRSYQNGTTLGKWGQKQKIVRFSNVQTKKKVFNNVSDFGLFLKMRGLHKVIVQKTVILPHLEDQGPYDFRWLVQCASGTRVTARVARVGRPASVTTNIHTGGVAMSASEVVRQTYPTSWQDKLTELDRIAIEIAVELKRRYGPFGEVGVDLALDVQGQPMVFEINPTPGRRMLRTLDPDLRQMSLATLLEYAISATGFNSD